MRDCCCTIPINGRRGPARLAEGLRPPAAVRSRQAAPFLDSPDPRMASLAAGVVRHHHDDGWFHATLAFNVGTSR